MNIHTGNYEFNTNLVVRYTEEEVVREIRKYFQRYDREFQDKVFLFLIECMERRNLKFKTE